MISQMIAYGIGIMIQIPYFSVILLIALVPIYLVQKKYRALNREVKRLDSVNNSKLYSHITETISGRIIIRAFQK